MLASLFVVGLIKSPAPDRLYEEPAAYGSPAVSTRAQAEYEYEYEYEWDPRAMT